MAKEPQGVTQCHLRGGARSFLDCELSLSSVRNPSLTSAVVTDTADENNSVRVQGSGKATCRLRLLLLCEDVFEPESLVMFFSPKDFFFLMVVLKVKQRVSVFYLYDCCLVDHNEDISDESCRNDHS